MKGHEKLRHNSSKVNVDDNGKTPKLRSLHLELVKGSRTKIVDCYYYRKLVETFHNVSECKTDVYFD